MRAAVIAMVLAAGVIGAVATAAKRPRAVAAKRVRTQSSSPTSLSSATSKILNEHACGAAP